MSIKVYDTLRADRFEFEPVRPGSVGMYVCGMTVQDKPHVGHMRAAVVGDVIRRTLAYFGHDVVFLNNFTDVDDKIIARGNQEGCDYQVIAERNMTAYLEAVDKIGNLRATHYPKATEHIPEIHELIERLVQKDVAYAAGGDVYFRVKKFAEYGKLSKRKVDDLRSGARIEPGEHKESPLDFAVWKGAKEGEPYWDSPWGKGRPGWHIECSAMAMKYLGETFDFHGGGLDLVFPHHENEIAQSEAATGKEFVRNWTHNGLVTLGGEKMSKSTQHFFLIEDLFARVDPATIRFYLLSTHYRSPIEFSEERLGEAGIAFGRLKATAQALRDALGAPPSREDVVEPMDPARIVDPELRTVLGLFQDAMRDDFNTAKAQGHLFELCRLLNRFLAEPASGAKDEKIEEGARLFHHLGDFLGLELRELGEVSVPDEIDALARARVEARQAKDWAKADQIRDELTALGWTVEDKGKTGEYVLKPKGC
ncbi:MAG: cysteine--tRNA ligase [Candidatus Eisenbacteria bacterium]|uniref:Cysteine--tRNA ligase n=1 Tax=Eiseniibacteriota bacterium TaxID=2212470 RepID=A0A956SEK7_UNCEI|nr:cysteine--tRNA ligase [Candidatus Eisenbacteria bacterium]MCB9463646.1 cysteine--tRNA ligase [Candidatus Eisenbacteria bacterium]